MTEHAGTQLRERAESMLAEFSTNNLQQPDELQRAVYELSVYQTELEIQNEELQRVQRELSAAHDRYKALFDDAPAGYLTIDNKNVIKEANVLVCEMFGAAAEELVGANLIQLICEEDMDVLFLHLRQTSRSNVTESCEARLAKPGCERIFRLDSQRVVGQDKENWTIWTVVTDISESKKRNELEIQAQKARQEERLKTLNCVAGGVAHDFNNLLLPITIHAELAKESLDSSQSTYSHIESIVNAADAATVLCQQLLDFTGSSHSELKPLNTGKTIGALLPILSSGFPDDQTLIVDCQCTEESIMADVVQFNRVLMNLTTNASEAIAGAAEGLIQISINVQMVDDIGLAKMLFAEGNSAGKYVVVSVSDNGCGISAEAMSRIFDPFFSTKFNGRGLGLASVFGIARKHGAAIDVSSSQKGTDFRMLFPAIEEETAFVSSDAAANEIVYGAGRILVVDDNAMVRNSTKQLLVVAGYEVETVESGQKAIEMATKQPDGFDLVLLDMLMPDMDGLTTLKEIRLLAPNILVCMTSGFAEDSTLEKLHALKLDGFISKPGSVFELTSRIHRAFASQK